MVCVCWKGHFWEGRRREAQSAVCTASSWRCSNMKASDHDVVRRLPSSRRRYYHHHYPIYLQNCRKISCDPGSEWFAIKKSHNIKRPQKKPPQKQAQIETSERGARVEWNVIVVVVRAKKLKQECPPRKLCKFVCCHLSSRSMQSTASDGRSLTHHHSGFSLARFHRSFFLVIGDVVMIRRDVTKSRLHHDIYTPFICDLYKTGWGLAALKSITENRIALVCLFPGGRMAFLNAYLLVPGGRRRCFLLVKLVCLFVCLFAGSRMRRMMMMMMMMYPKCHLRLLATAVDIVVVWDCILHRWIIIIEREDTKQGDSASKASNEGGFTPVVGRPTSKEHQNIATRE